MTFQVKFAILALLVPLVLEAEDICIPNCTSNDTCILIIKPSQPIILYEGDIFNVVLKVGSLDLANVYLCAENGKICTEINGPTPLTLARCTTSVNYAVPPLSRFFEEPPESTICILRVSPYGDRPTPRGICSSKIVVKKKSSVVRTHYVTNRKKHTVKQLKHFSLTGRYIPLNANMPFVTIERMTNVHSQYIDRLYLNIRNKNNVHK